MVGCATGSCFGFSPRWGLLIWAVVNFILAFVTFIFAMYVQIHPELLKEVDEYGNEDLEEEDSNSSTSTTVVIISFVHMLASIALSIGSSTKGSALLKVWRIYAIIFGLFAIVDNIVDVFAKFSVNDIDGGFGVLIQTALMGGLWTYMIIVVNGYIIILKEEDALKPTAPEEIQLDGVVQR